MHFTEGRRTSSIESWTSGPWRQDYQHWCSWEIGINWSHMMEAMFHVNVFHSQSIIRTYLYTSSGSSTVPQTIGYSTSKMSFELRPFCRSKKTVSRTVAAVLLKHPNIVLTAIARDIVEVLNDSACQALFHSAQRIGRISCG